MDRNRDARRASILGSNGFNRRRSRTNSLRDSPDEDGGLELQESVRLRDRVKKDRDQERDRDRERERGREREKERERSSRSKRRRGDESSEESFDFDENDDDEENAGGGVRLLTQTVVSGHISNHHNNHSSSFSQQQHNSNSINNTVSSNHHLQHRKSFPPNLPSAKISRAPPVWKSGDEMISAAVPRKARSASTKRFHDWMSTSSNNVGGGALSVVEQNLMQPWSSPSRQTPTPPPPPAHPPMSPTSSSASIRKKLKLTANNSGQKLKPPKAATAMKPSSNPSNPEELEIEIAEVLYGLKTHSQAPSSKKEESKEINRLSNDAKSRNSSPISNSSSANALLSAIAPRRKKPRQTPENSSYGARSSSIPAKPEADQAPTIEKILGSATENGIEIAGNSVDPAQIDPPHASTSLESAKMHSELKPAAEETRESTDSVAKEEVSSPKETKSPALRAEVIPKLDSAPAVAASSTELEKRKEEKLEIDLMAPPPQVRTDLIDSGVDKKTVVSTDNLKHEEDGTEEKKVKAAGEEVESNKAIEKEERKVDLHIDSEKSERDGGHGVNYAGNGNKSQSLTQKQPQPFSEKYGHSASSLVLPMSMGSWPGGLHPMGYIPPMQGVVSMEGGTAAPGHVPLVFSQTRPKRCATHCHIARNIHCLQQFMKINPFWPAPAASASLFGSKPCNLNVMPGPDSASVRVANSTQDKSQNIAIIPNHVTKEKASQPASTLDSAQRKQQILIQQALPPIAPSNMLGPAFIVPLNQHKSTASRPSGVISPANATVSATTSGSAVTSSSPAAAMSFNYPNMASNETQYLAIVQNNGYSFPIPAAAVGAPPNYRGNPAQAMPLFNGPFYPPQMIHPSQLQHAQPPSIQSQLLQPHQNGGASSGSSASQKHLQSQHNLHKTQSSQQKFQPSQQSHCQHVQQSRPRHHEGEAGREDSPSTTDSRGSQASVNIYGQNFSMIHPQNFSLVTHPAVLASSGAATSANSNHADKKGNQPQQQGSSKTGPDSLPAHSFAMTFGTMNGAANIQMMTAAAQIKNGRVSDDGKSGGFDSSATEDERKSSSSTGKALGGGSQSIAFTRPDLTMGSRSLTTNTVEAMNVQNAHNIQALFQQQMQQQLIKQQQQHQQQQHIMAAAKVAVNSNGGMHSEHLNSSSSKFPNALSGFPQNLVQNSSSSPSQSPQWKASGRTSTSTSTPQTTSSTATTLKNLPQQHSRKMHTQISFGGNQKPSAAHPTNNQTTSSVGSPTISSVSKGASGIPRTTSSASTNNKIVQASSLPAQATKNSPSILGSVQKSQTQNQMQRAMQQQLFFSNLYSQSQSGKSSTTPGASGYYMARKQTEQQQQSPGVLVTLGGANTNDPATAITAATANVKGGGIIHASQFAAQPVLPAGFSYAHPVPAAVQVKPAEQKQPAGNDNLHPWQPEKK